MGASVASGPRRQVSASPATTRLLVVSPRADDRVETRVLVDVVRALRRRDDVTVELWWLRGERGAADRVVDELRTDRALALLDRIPVAAIANGIRGRVLRRWIRDADPGWIILDGGLGDRAVTHSQARRAIRVTATPSPDAAAEGAPRTDADLWLLPSTADATSGSDRTELELGADLAERGDAVPFRASSARRTVRGRLGLPTEGRLVVGWSGDGRGAAEFSRVLEVLRSDHDVTVTGLWLGDEPTTSSQSHTVQLHHRATRPLDVRLCGDAVVLVGTAPVAVSEAHDALVAGLPVIAAAPPLTAYDRDVHVVAAGSEDPSDLAAALAGALVAVDDATTAEAGALAAARLDLRTWVPTLLGALGAVAADTPGTAG